MSAKRAPAQHRLKSGWARAFAPATVSNVAVGFDLLGYPFGKVGDEVMVWSWDRPGVHVEQVRGGRCEVPLDARRNTGAIALAAMVRELGLPGGFGIRIKKGIPMGSGMGGSAASAVGAVVALNALLAKPLKPEALIPFALKGEAAASGGQHADNIVPSLLGGLRLCLGLALGGAVDEAGAWPEVPVPARVRSVLVHPELVVETRAARALLKPQIFLAEHVRQNACMAGFLSACASGDLELLSRSMMDLIVEPQRMALIPGFEKVKQAALAAGALGCSISGSGPSVFAWTPSDIVASRVERAMVAVFREQGLAVESWRGPIERKGARVIARGRGVPK
ncbi:MAG: homoserine kinase [Bdellovibrionales bacterium]|nr:homoserine kinase [Bdellovibrionales bacterium]